MAASLLSFCTVLSPEEVSEPSRGLLHHNKHMTLTLEQHYGCKLDLEVFESSREGDELTRHIALTDKQRNLRVQYATARVNLSALAEPVCADIVGEREPIGHVLVKHNVQRSVTCESLVLVQRCPLVAERLGLPVDTPLYGRQAFITCDGVRAIDVLEILRPVQ
jgi:chorismate-pyruvate lyase